MNRYSKCKIVFDVRQTDRDTGKNMIVPVWKYNMDIPDDRMDKVMQACACNDYSYSRYFVHTELVKLRHMIYWEWKRR